MLMKYKEQVSDRGPEASLPRNLSDDWLRIVMQGTKEMLSGEDQGGPAGAVAMVAVLSILGAKQGSGDLSVDLDQMHRHFEDFRIELALEEVHRATDMKYEPATIETIFTNRDVQTWREARG